MIETMMNLHLIMCPEKKRFCSINDVYILSGEIMKVCNTTIKRATIPWKRFTKFLNMLTQFDCFDEVVDIIIGIL